MKQKEYKTSEYVVAFIDILGAKEMIMNNPTGLQIVHEVYDKATFEIKNSKEYLGTKIDTKIFSDNLVLYFKVATTDDFEIANNISDLLMYIGFIQNDFLRKGILVRGGIAVGDFFADEVMIWGEALVKSYKLESEIAIYPRVVIDPKIIEKYYYIEYGLNLDNNIIQDFDKIMFVNYLNGLTHNEYWELLKKSTSYTNSFDLKTAQKIQWHDYYIGRLMEQTKGSEPNA